MAARRTHRRRLRHPTVIRKSFTDDTWNYENDCDHNNDEGLSQESLGRRGFFRQVVQRATIASLITTILLPGGSTPAHARGLVRFPCVAPLLNVYHLMCAGTSLLEEEDIWSTNPLFLTNREAALSEKGFQQVQDACRILQQADINPSVIKYSLAASAVDTAMVIRDELQVGQNRLIPEFTFMDPRAIGKWDMRSIAETFPAVVAMDELEAGKDGKGARPPPNTDGTPQDTLADQAIRLRQLMSVLETQFSGDNIVLVFPDGSSPALLSAMIAGIPYNKAHVLEFAPGEIRLDVRMASTLQLYETKLQQNAQVYNSWMEQGKKELDRLRSLSDDELISKKDILIEEERLAMEEEYQRKEAVRLAKEQEDRQARLARQRELTRSLQPQQQRGSSMDGTDRIDEASLPPLVIGGAFAAYAVVALSSAGQNNESKYSKNNSNATDTMVAVGNSTLALPLSPGGLYNNGFTDNRFGDSSSSNAAMSGTFPSNILDETLPSLYGETSGMSSTIYNSPSNTKPVDERKEDARTAMQKYMDEDDGGGAWLQVMADIIRQDDDDDKDPFFQENDEDMGRINGSSNL